MKKHHKCPALLQIGPWSLQKGPEMQKAEGVTAVLDYGSWLSGAIMKNTKTSSAQLWTGAARLSFRNWHQLSLYFNSNFLNDKLLTHSIMRGKTISFVHFLQLFTDFFYIFRNWAWLSCNNRHILLYI